MRSFIGASAEDSRPIFLHVFQRLVFGALLRCKSYRCTPRRGRTDFRSPTYFGSVTTVSSSMYVYTYSVEEEFHSAFSARYIWQSLTKDAALFQPEHEENDREMTIYGAIHYYRCPYSESQAS